MTDLVVGMVEFGRCTCDKGCDRCYDAEAYKRERALIKPKFTLIPPDALREVAKILTVGGLNRNEYEWREKTVEDYLNKVYRHSSDYQNGILTDKDTGLPSLAAAAADAILALAISMRNEKITKVAQTN